MGMAGLCYGAVQQTRVNRGSESLVGERAERRAMKPKGVLNRRLIGPSPP